MKNYMLKTILFFSFFLVLFSLAGYAEPLLSLNSSSLSTNYNVSFIYEFSSVWDGNITANENITECNFTLGRPDGSFIIYPIIPNPTTSPSLCYKNFTQDQLGPAGNYSWSWSVKNDTSWTVFSIFNFIIEKAPTTINLFLNDGEVDKNYSLNQNANFTALLNVPGKNITLTSNMTGLTLNSTTSNITIVTNLTTAGLFFINSSFDGDQNYSASFSTHSFGVLPYWVSNATLPTSASTYSAGKNYSFMIKWIGNVSDIKFESNFNGTMINYTNNTFVNNWNNSIYIINDSSGNYWINFTDLSAGSYSYSWYANDTYNNFVKTGQFNYVIIPIPTSLTLTCSDSDWSITSGTTVSFTCTSNNSVRMSVTVGSFSPINSNGSVASLPSGDVTGLTSNTYVSCSLLDNNYSVVGTDWSHWLTVGTATPTPTSGQSSSPYSTPSAGTFSITNLTSSLAINAGDSKQVSFTLKNTLGKGAIVNVTISVTGIDSNWYTPLSKIKYSYNNVPQTLILTFNIPANAEAKIYTVKIVAAGTLVLNSSTINTPDATMKLTVNNTNQTVVIPSSEVNNTEIANETQNVTGSEQIVAPTGLASTFEYLKNNLLIIITMAACVLIFIFREDVNENLAKVAGKPYKTRYKNSFDFSSIKKKMNYKLPDFGKFKINKRKLEPEKPGVKRPEMLEREIKRDIKELQNIIDVDRKMSKKKKFDIENN